jgi:hypothetical protein
MKKKSMVADQEIVDDLAARWAIAKDEEGAARDRRLAIEAEIVALLGAKDEGSETHKGDDYKITVKGSLYRKVDADAWGEIVEQVPPEFRAVIRYKPEVDPKGYKWISDHRPDVLGLISRAITATPGKPGISVALIPGKGDNHGV